MFAGCGCGRKRALCSRKDAQRVAERGRGLLRPFDVASCRPPLRQHCSFEGRAFEEPHPSGCKRIFDRNLAGSSAARLRVGDMRRQTGWLGLPGQVLERQVQKGLAPP